VPMRVPATIVLVLGVLACATGVSAQTAPLPAPFSGDTNGFLTRGDWLIAGRESRPAIGGRVEGGERRVDAYPFVRVPLSCVEAGFRLSSP